MLLKYLSFSHRRGEVIPIDLLDYLSDHIIVKVFPHKDSKHYILKTGKGFQEKKQMR